MASIKTLQALIDAFNNKERIVFMSTTDGSGMSGDVQRIEIKEDRVELHIYPDQKWIGPTIITYYEKSGNYKNKTVTGFHKFIKIENKNPSRDI